MKNKNLENLKNFKSNIFKKYPYCTVLDTNDCTNDTLPIDFSKLV